MGLHGIRELRRDIITGRWVVVNSAIARVPGIFARHAEAPCPICQADSPGLFVFHADGSSEREVKVVANFEPVLRIEGTPDGVLDGPWERYGGVGANELVIESPQHGVRIAELAEGRLADVFHALRARMLDLRRDQRLQHFTVIREPRPHGAWEIVGLPVLPDRWIGESVRTYRHWEQTATCATCDMLAKDLATGTRVISADDEAVALAPYASRHPFEVWILPRKHGSHFENALDAQLNSAARALEKVTRQIDTVLEQPDLLITLQTAGSQEIGHHGLLAHAHWRLEVTPVLLSSAATQAAGQFFVNPVPPEEAARYLREAL